MSTFEEFENTLADKLGLVRKKAGDPCPRCGRALVHGTLTRTKDNTTETITLVRCPTCHVPPNECTCPPYSEGGW